MRARYQAREELAELYYALRMLVRVGYTYESIATWLDVSPGTAGQFIAEARRYLGDFRRRTAIRRGEVPPDDLSQLWEEHRTGAPPSSVQPLKFIPASRRRRLPILRPSWHVEDTPARELGRPVTKSLKPKPKPVTLRKSRSVEASTVAFSAPGIDVARFEAVAERLEALAESMPRVVASQPDPKELAPDRQAEIALGWMVSRLCDALGDLVVAQMLEIPMKKLPACRRGETRGILHNELTFELIQRRFASMLFADDVIDEDDIEEARRLLRRSGRSRLDMLAEGIS